MNGGAYVMVPAPQEYPGEIYQEGYCYEHELVWWINRGSLPETGYVVWHKDRDPRNNDIDNLYLKRIKQRMKNTKFEGVDF